MRPGDQLVDINGHGVEGLNAEEATALIRQVCVCVCEREREWHGVHLETQLAVAMLSDRWLSAIYSSAPMTPGRKRFR